jgi:hypothetical protein
MPKQKDATQRINRIVKEQLLAVLAGLCLGSLIYLGKYLSGLGSHGDHVAQVWGPSLSILGIISGTWLGILQLTQQKRAPQGGEQADETPKVARQKMTAITPLHLVVVLVVAVIAFCLPPVVNRIAFDHWQQDNVLSQLSVKGGTTMTDGSQATIMLPATKHTKLTISLALDSLIATGSCVAPARLTVTPTHDGNDEQSLPAVQSGTEQTITIHKDTATQLLVALDMSEEPSCSVKLNVTKAMYYQ